MANTPSPLRPASRARTSPGKSVLSDKVIPIVLISLGALTLILIAVALGVLLGMVRF